MTSEGATDTMSLILPPESRGEPCSQCMPHGTLLCEKLPTSSSHFRIGNRLEKKPLLEILLCFFHARYRIGMLSNPAVALLPPGSKVCLNVVLVDDDAEIRRHMRRPHTDHCLRH